MKTMTQCKTCGCEIVNQDPKCMMDETDNYEPYCELDEPGEYGVAYMVSNGPEDYDWEPDQYFETLREAKERAKAITKPTEYGPSGVRVINLQTDQEVWSNC